MYRILFFLLLIPGISFTQEVEDKKSRFPLFELSKGDDNTKNINWGDYHYNNENYGKAVERYQKVTNPSVEIQRKMALAFIEIDSVDRALVMFETIVNAGDDINPEDYLNLSQLQELLQPMKTGKDDSDEDPNENIVIQLNSTTGTPCPMTQLEEKRL